MALLSGLGIAEAGVVSRASAALKTPKALFQMKDLVPNYLVPTTATEFAAWTADRLADAGKSLAGPGERIDRHRLPHLKRAYPFYCALLYTDESGLDGELHRYVVESSSILNVLTHR